MYIIKSIGAVGVSVIVLLLYLFLLSIIGQAIPNSPFISAFFLAGIPVILIGITYWMVKRIDWSE